MRSNNGSAGLVILVVVMAVLLAVSAYLVVNQANKSRAELPVLNTLPDFTFTERGGQPFGLKDMQGKINVVDFIFTNCLSVCPVMATKMIDLYDLYEGSDKIQFISISVDPDRDSLPVLRQYALDHGVTDNRWLFLSAPMDQVVSLSEKGFMLPADQLPMGHSARFVLVDGRGQIRGYYDSFDDASLDILKTHLKALLQQAP